MSRPRPSARMPAAGRAAPARPAHPAAPSWGPRLAAWRPDWSALSARRLVLRIGAAALAVGGLALLVEQKGRGALDRAGLEKLARDTPSVRPGPSAPPTPPARP